MSARRPADDLRPSPIRRGAAVAALLLATGCQPRHGRVLDQGSGPENEGPLWPLGAGLSWSDDARPVVVAQRDTRQGRLITLDLSALNVDLRFVGRRTMDLLETANGDLVGVEPDGQRYLFVPGTVREGMRFRFKLSHPEHSFVSADGLQSELDVGDGVWTAEVLERREERGRWGEQTIWTIAYTGPRVPHQDAGGGKVPFAPDPTSMLTQETTEGELPRWGMVLELVEGVGPTQFVPGPLGAPMRSAGPRVWTGEADWDPAALDAPSEPVTPAPSALPPPLPGPLAGLTPQAAPTLEAEPLGTLYEPEGGWFLSQTARYTWASEEADAGAAGELVLMGTAFGTSTLYDPNGQRIDDFVGATAALCLAIDPSGEVRPIEELAGPCPNRNPDALGRNAHPYARPDGRRWDRPDAMRAPDRAGSASTGGTFTIDAVATEAPFVRDGVQHAITCGGRGPGGAGLLAAASLQGCHLLSFNKDEPTLLSADTVNELPLEAMAVFKQQPAQPPFLGARRSDAYAPPGVSHDSLTGTVTTAVVIPELTFAVPFDDRVAYVAVASGGVASGAIWMDYAGNTLHRELLPLWNPSVSNRDGAITLSDVGPQGELRVVHVHPDGLEVELRGRVELPEHHRAVYAVELHPGRFLVLAEAPGEGEGPGRPVPAVYESNVSAFLVQPAVPPSRLELRGFLVSAPDRGEVDRDWLLRRPVVQRAGTMVRVCEPPLPASVAAPPTRVRAVRVGGRVVEVADEGRDARGCLLIPSTEAERALSVELGSTPVAVELDGQGWVTHVLPPLSDALPARAGDWAALPDGSRRYLDAQVFPFGAEEWPVSARARGVDVDCWRFDGLYYNNCRDHLLYGDFGNDTASWSGHQDRLLPDRGGRGLWAVLAYRWSSWRGGPGPGPNELDGGFALCRPELGPCLDPLATEAPPATFDEGDAPLVLLADRVEAPRWEAPGFTHAAPSGGLVGGEHRLTADGAVLPLPVTFVGSLFRVVTHRWTDGSACGYTWSDTSFTCYTATGLWVPYPNSGWTQIDTFLRPAEWVAVDPGLLVTVTPLLARFENNDVTVGTERALYVRLLDLAARQERTVRVGSLLPAGVEPTTDDASPLNLPGEAQVTGPIAGPDGSVWWSAGPPLSRWVRAGDGQIRVGDLPAGATSLWSVGADRILFAPGVAVTPEELIGESVCTPSPEVCNGVDDDCDDTIDEADPAAPLCDATHGEVSCIAGACVVASCDVWFDDCDGDPRNGCETPLGTDDDCLACGDTCPVLGGSTCAAAGCLDAQVAALVATSRTPVVLYHNGDARVGATTAGSLIDVAAGRDHYCTLDATGGLACTCEAPGGLACSAAGVGLSLPELDRVWAGERSTCARTVWGAVLCWGDVATDDGAPLPWPYEVPELVDADEIVFGGPHLGQACASLGGAVSCFGPAQGSGPFEVRPVELPGPVDALAAGPGYVLYDVGGEIYATGVLWRYPALGGPQAPAVWTTPTRVPGLDGALALVPGFAPAGEGVPCKLLADRVACPYQPGSPWQSSQYTFDAPAVVHTDDPWVDLPGAFQAGAGAGSTLCLVSVGEAGDARCRGGAVFP